MTARIDGAPADLPAGLDLAAYRIVQEALTNTLKHARAQAAEVNLRYSPAGLVLEVTDDGQPAAPAGPRGPAPGRGLIGIRERAALHGGTCQAGPRPGGGFAVRVSLPLDASGRAGTVASGTAPMPPRQTAALKETALSRPAQPDPRSRPRWRRWLLIAGDAALALALAAGAVAEPAARSGPGGRHRPCPAADAAAGGAAVAPGRGCWPWWPPPRWARRSPEMAVVLVRSACWWRCTRWPRTARGGRRPGPASPPGPP